jgi:hypothetical protein
MPNLIKICSPIHTSLESGTQVKEDIMYFTHKKISTGIALDNKMIGRYVLEPLDI